MTRGRKPIRTRQQIQDYLESNMIKKGILEADAKKRVELFVFHMGFIRELRPQVKGMAETLKVDRNFMSKLIERWEHNEQ